MFAQYALHLEPIFSINAIRTFVAFEALLNKITTSAVVINVDEIRLEYRVDSIFFLVVIARKC